MKRRRLAVGEVSEMRRFFDAGTQDPRVDAEAPCPLVNCGTDLQPQDLCGRA